MISLVILSGRSGSGKSTALHVLEDLGFYCIDNLPVGLLQPLIKRLSQQQTAKKVSVSIDARNIAEDLLSFPDVIKSIFNTLGNRSGSVKAHEQIEIIIVFLDSSSSTLVRRFSETRRKHPLSNAARDLRAALEYETELLDAISGMADLHIDTTRLTIHELRDLISTRITGNKREMAILMQSFAFKNGVPIDADLVFDVRCLPNPHWIAGLRTQTGLDQPVQAFLDRQIDVSKMFDDISGFLKTWLPKFQENNRSYMTIGIGCTGGQHRSVYLTERIYTALTPTWRNVQVKHRELAKPIGH